MLASMAESVSRITYLPGTLNCISGEGVFWFEPLMNCQAGVWVEPQPRGSLYVTFQLYRSPWQPLTGEVLVNSALPGPQLLLRFIVNCAVGGVRTQITFMVLSKPHLSLKIY